MSTDLPIEIGLRRYLGDSSTLTIPLVNPDTGADFGSVDGWQLIFTIKALATDPDSRALIQKASDVAGITAANPAEVALVPDDYARVSAGCVYVFDVVANNYTTGETKTVRKGWIEFESNVTRTRAVAVPIYSTEPSAPANFAEQAAASATQALAARDATLAALPTWQGTANLTTLGVITTGQWQASPVADSYISSASVWNAAASSAAAHAARTDNPHSVTKAQVGLGNVENTALSTWAGTASITTLGTISTGVWHGAAIADNYIASAGSWNAAASSAAAHAARTDNPHGVTKAQVGLGNVENTALSTWSGSSNITTLGTIASTLTLANGTITTSAPNGNIVLTPGGTPGQQDRLEGFVSLGAGPSSGYWQPLRWGAGFALESGVTWWNIDGSQSRQGVLGAIADPVGGWSFNGIGAAGYPQMGDTAEGCYGRGIERYFYVTTVDRSFSCRPWQTNVTVLSGGSGFDAALGYTINRFDGDEFNLYPRNASGSGPTAGARFSLKPTALASSLWLNGWIELSSHALFDAGATSPATVGGNQFALFANIANWPQFKFSNGLEAALRFSNLTANRTFDFADVSGTLLTHNYAGAVQFGSTLVVTSTGVFGSSIGATGAGAFSVGNSSGNSYMLVGQDTTHRLQLRWTYSATAGSASSYIDTFGYANPLDINASTLRLQNSSAGATIIGGTLTVNNSITTGAPASGTAAAWKLGSLISGTYALDTTRCAQIDIGGTALKLALVA